MSSLRMKWIASLLLTSLVGVVLVGLFAYQTTVSEYDRLRLEQAQQIFVDDMSGYYQANGGWDGVETWMRQSRFPPVAPFAFLPPQLFALADADGVIMMEFGPYETGDRLAPEQIAQGTPILVDGQRVGTGVLVMPPPALDPREQAYLNNTTRALLIGAVGAVSVALLVGILLARHFLSPLTELTGAIAAMRQGNLEQQVQVRTRDELGRLAQTFNQMSAEIHRVNHLRKQMTADVAHDLRSPLLVIIGYLEAMRNGVLPPTPERLEAMNQEAMLLQRLVEDLRILSLTDEGKLNLIYEKVQADEFLAQVRQSFAPLADEQEIVLEVDVEKPLPLLHIDRERMMQVLANLMTNALRYTAAGGKIILAARRVQECVQLAVIDTGKGIPAEKLPNIFERFYRIEESRYQSHAESGLGLAIAKSIVEAHHGTITAESFPGAGTSIRILLPLQ